MILRTPPPKRPRDAAGEPIIECPPTAGGSDRRLIIYEDPSPAGRESSHQPSDHLLCTYQCRQMVLTHHHHYYNLLFIYFILLVKCLIKKMLSYHVS